MSSDVQLALQMQTAITDDNTDEICNAINAGADVNLRDASGATPLQTASRLGKSESAYVLLQMGADPDLRDDNGRTALHVAAAEGDTKMTELLLRNDANPAAADNHKRTPLHIAADKGLLEVVKLLVEAAQQPEDIVRPDEEGLSPRALVTRRVEQATGRVDENQFKTAMFLQEAEQARGVDPESEKLRKEKVAADIAKLKSLNPAKYKIKPALPA